MRKLLLLMFALLTGVSGAWATSTYFVAGRSASITTGKQYMIYNTACRYFLSANGSSGYSGTGNTTPLAYNTTDANYVWTLEAGSTTGTFKIKNVGTSDYAAGGTSLGAAVDYDIAEFSTCPSKGGMASYNDDGTTTAAASIAATDKTVYIVQNGTTDYWNDSSGSLGVYSRAHVYVLYEVVEIADGGLYTIDFVSQDGTKTWGLSTSGTSASATLNTTGSTFVAYKYTNANNQPRWIFVNNADGRYLAYNSAMENFDMSHATGEWAVASLASSSSAYITGGDRTGKMYITVDNRSTSNTSAGCFILKESTAGFDNSAAPYWNGTFTSALSITPVAGTPSSAAQLAIAKFDALLDWKSYKAGVEHIPALYPTADVAEIETNINAATDNAGVVSALNAFWHIAEGRKFYAVPSTATGQYMEIGTSQITATSTKLYAENVMELEYASNGKYYLKGVKSGYYSGNPNSGNANPGTHAAKADATPLYVGNLGSTDNQVYFARTTTGGYIEAIHYNNSYSGYVVAWTYNAGASNWNITAVSDEEYDDLCNVCDVTYNVVLEASGTVKATTTQTEVIGNALDVPSAAARDYCTYTYYTDAACTNQLTTVPNSGSATVYALASVDLPFTVSTDYASATWYYVNGHATYANKYISTNGDATVWGDNNGHTDAYKWAFIGNPYDGFQVINKAAGNGKYLQETDPLTMGTTAKAWPVRQQTNTSWHSGANGFGLWSDTNSKYVNTQGSTLKYWGSFDQGSTYWVTEVPEYEVTVTYELWVGSEKVNTVVEEYVTGGSAVNVPASLTANYSTLAYDFSTSGTIGNSDCTITVTATPKTGVVTSLSQLSNSKAYTLTTERGALYIKSDHLASNGYANDGATAGKFALINVDNDYYLYSTDVNKYVQKDGTLSSTVTSDVVALTMTEQTLKPLYLFVFGSNGLNVTNTSDDYELVINSYATPDAGNKYCIVEADDVDVSAAEDALEDYFHGQTAFNNIIAALKAVNWGLTSEGNHGKLGYYNFTENASADIYAYSGNEMTFLNMLEGMGYNAENLQVAQSLNSPGNAYALNLPAAGFYRIQGHGDANSSDKYLAAGMANNRFAMSDATDATTIFYFDGTKLTNLSSGMCNGMTKDAWAWTTGAAASTVTFGDGGTNGGYSILSNNAYFYDGGTSADRGSSLGADGRYRNWCLTEVTSLPVTISSVGYATLYAPVALEIPDGVTAYIATIENTSYLHLEEVEGGIIPANTGVILAGDEGSYDFVITTGGNVDSNVLTGTAVAIARPADSYILSNGGSGVGFYGDGAETIPGFKAYLPASAVSNARGFLGFSFGEATAIEAIEAALNSGKAVYDLNGRRVENPSNGVYIVNGKKVIINKK